MAAPKPQAIVDKLADQVGALFPPRKKLSPMMHEYLSTNLQKALLVSDRDLKAKAHVLYGLFLMHIGEQDDALNNIKIGLDLKGKSYLENLKNVAILFQFYGFFEESADLWSRFFNTDLQGIFPDSLFSYIGLVLLRGEGEQAIELFNKHAKQLANAERGIPFIRDFIESTKSMFDKLGLAKEDIAWSLDQALAVMREFKVPFFEINTVKPFLVDESQAAVHIEVLADFETTMAMEKALFDRAYAENKVELANKLTYLFLARSNDDVVEEVEHAG